MPLSRTIITRKITGAPFMLVIRESNKNANPRERFVIAQYGAFTKCVSGTDRVCSPGFRKAGMLAILMKVLRFRD